MADIPLDKLKVKRVTIYLPDGQRIEFDDEQIVDVGVVEGVTMVDERRPGGVRDRWIGFPQRVEFVELSRLVKPGETQGH